MPQEYKGVIHFGLQEKEFCSYHQIKIIWGYMGEVLLSDFNVWEKMTGDRD